MHPSATVQDGLNAGLRLHKFEVNAVLPRVQRLLGILHGLAPENLLDIGSGRGTFLSPLLAAFPELRVTAVDSSERRSSDLAAVRRGRS
jgi:16S rRNA G527 N7-methylase RsmG